MISRLVRSIVKARGTYVLLLFLLLLTFSVSAYRASDILFSSGKDKLVAQSNEGYTEANGEPDVTPPEIFIQGNNPAQVEIGSSYLDNGAYIPEIRDKYLDITIYVNGVLTEFVNLDTDTDGVHSIVYKATDLAGNEGQAERIVYVGDPFAEPVPEPPTEELEEESIEGPKEEETNQVVEEEYEEVEELPFVDDSIPLEEDEIYIVGDEIIRLDEDDYYTDDFGNSIHLESEDYHEELELSHSEDENKVQGDEELDQNYRSEKETDKPSEDIDSNHNDKQEEHYAHASISNQGLELEEEKLTEKNNDEESEVHENTVDIEIETSKEGFHILPDENEVWIVKIELAEEERNTSFDELLEFESFEDIEVYHSEEDFAINYNGENNDIEEAIEILVEEILDEKSLFEKRDDESLKIDSDRDGITNYDEIAIYNTNPFDDKTLEGDLTDSEKILSGINPLSDKPIVFEDPRVALEPIVEEYKVSELNVKQVSEELGGDGSIKLEFRGFALPNSFVTLYIFSTPIVVTVKTDGDGAWVYELDKELEDGNHEIFVATVDNSGKILAKSSGVPFVKVANAAELGASIGSEDGAAGFLRGNFVLIFFAISILGVLIMIVIVGSDLRRNRLDKVV